MPGRSRTDLLIPHSPAGGQGAPWTPFSSTLAQHGTLPLHEWCSSFQWQPDSQRAWKLPSLCVTREKAKCVASFAFSGGAAGDAQALQARAVRTNAIEARTILSLVLIACSFT